MGGVSNFSTQDSVIKFLSADYSLHQITLLRALIAIVFTMLVLVPFEGGLRALYTRRLTLHLLRGTAVVLANLLFFTGLATLPLGETTALIFIAPLLILLFAAVFLRERVTPRRWIAVGIGLLGTLVMIRPGSDLFNPTMILPLLAALCYATFQTMTRLLGTTEKASTMAFFVQVAFILISSAVGLVAGDGRFDPGDDPTLGFLLRAWIWPTGADWILLFGTGCLSALGAYLISQGYRISNASLLAPFEYTALPFALAWSIFFFGDWPDYLSWLGIALIAGSGLYAFADVRSSDNN